MEFDLTYLFIAHNLSVVQYVSDRVGVMYLGRLVELAPVDVLYECNPRHPYTVALLSAVPEPDPTKRGRRMTSAYPPSPAAPPAGCRFHTRCWLREQLGDPEPCETVPPELRVISPAHEVACHFPELITPQTVAGRAARVGPRTPAAPPA